jgi:hypothetical protein
MVSPGHPCTSAEVPNCKCEVWASSGHRVRDETKCQLFRLFQIKMKDITLNPDCKGHDSRMYARRHGPQFTKHGSIYEMWSFSGYICALESSTYYSALWKFRRQVNELRNNYSAEYSATWYLAAFLETGGLRRGNRNYRIARLAWDHIEERKQRVQTMRALVRHVFCRGSGVRCGGGGHCGGGSVRAFAITAFSSVARRAARGSLNPSRFL